MLLTVVSNVLITFNTIHNSLDIHMSRCLVYFSLSLYSAIDQPIIVGNMFLKIENVLREKENSLRFLDLRTCQMLFVSIKLK